MFRGVFGKLLGNASATVPSPDILSPVAHAMHSIRGYCTGVGSFVGDKRNILDHKRRKLAAKYELQRKLYKALCRDPDLPSNMKDKFRAKLSKVPRNSAFNRLRNRCIFTGRPRAVYEKFRMSRIVFRDLANKGQLPGVRKSSW